MQSHLGWQVSEDFDLVDNRVAIGFIQFVGCFYPVGREGWIGTFLVQLQHPRTVQLRSPSFEVEVMTRTMKHTIANHWIKLQSRLGHWLVSMCIELDPRPLRRFDGTVLRYGSRFLLGVFWVFKIDAINCDDWYDLHAQIERTSIGIPGINPITKGLVNAAKTFAEIQSIIYAFDFFVHLQSLADLLAIG